MVYTLTQSLRSLLLFLSFASACASAQTVAIGDPLLSRNLDPLLGNLGVPMMTSAAGLDGGAWQGGWSFHWASHSHRESGDGLAVEYDGETQRHDFSIAVGLGHGLTLSLNLPWVAHDGGSLDSLIDDWHGFWGMPDGARDVQPADRLRFTLNGDNGFLLQESVSGFGDAELSLALRLWESASGGVLAGFAHYKANTGSVDDFTGSGEDAIGAGLRYSAETCIWAPLSCHGQLGIIDIGNVAQGPDGSDTVLFGGLTLAWSFRADLAVVGQLELQEQAYGAGPFREVGTPVLGTLGMRWMPKGPWQLEAQFSEDLNVGSAPDVTFRVSVARSW